MVSHRLHGFTRINFRKKNSSAGKTIIYGLFLLVFIGCQGDNNNNTAVKKERLLSSDLKAWDEIVISLNDEFFFIKNDEDTVFYKVYDRKLISFDSTTKKGIDKNYSERFFMSKSEKDSLFEYCFLLITKPFFIADKVSCYAGDNIDIRVLKYQSTISFKSVSVKDWLLLSPQMPKINSLTFKKVNRRYE